MKWLAFEKKREIEKPVFSTLKLVEMNLKCSTGNFYQLKRLHNHLDAVLMRTNILMLHIVNIVGPPLPLASAQLIGNVEDEKVDQPLVRRRTSLCKICRRKAGKLSHRKH